MNAGVDTKDTADDEVDRERKGCTAFALNLERAEQHRARHHEEHGHGEIAVDDLQYHLAKDRRGFADRREEDRIDRLALRDQDAVIDADGDRQPTAQAVKRLVPSLHPQRLPFPSRFPVPGSGLDRAGRM